MRVANSFGAFNLNEFAIQAYTKKENGAFA